MVEPHSSNFRVIRTNILGVRVFRNFRKYPPYLLDWSWVTETKPQLESLNFARELQYNKTNKMTCVPSEDSLLSTWRNLEPLATHSALSEDWSDLVDAQADLSICWVYRSFCWFCRTVAHVTYFCVLYVGVTLTFTKTDLCKNLVLQQIWNSKWGEERNFTKNVFIYNVNYVNIF